MKYYHILNLKMGKYTLDSSSGRRITIANEDNLNDLIQHWRNHNYNGRWVSCNIHPDCVKDDFMLICSEY